VPPPCQAALQVVESIDLQQGGLGRFHDSDMYINDSRLENCFPKNEFFARKSNERVFTTKDLRRNSYASKSVKVKMVVQKSIHSIHKVGHAMAYYSLNVHIDHKK